MTAIVISSADNVAVAGAAIEAGGEVLPGVVAKGRIDVSHKVAIRAIVSGAPVIKYGQIIGVAIGDILPGDHVHAHNLKFDKADARNLPPAPAAARVAGADPARTFMGYRRRNGRAGTRNFIGVISSVNCSATVCRRIAARANQEILPLYDAIDGFVPIVHKQGCGIDPDGEGMRVLHRSISGYARHANFGGILMVGLGCEANQISLYPPEAQNRLEERFTMQDSGGTTRSVEHALERLHVIAAELSGVRREPIPVGELVLGLQCGGSDGLSGITANPALGAAVDLLVASGGTAILSETPEIFGAEHLLTSRATSPELARRINDMIAWWKDYVGQSGASLDNNPSPGNKRGGLTTILEKSLGAVAKGGASPIADVLDYAQPVRAHGLVFMDTPGYDPVSATGQIAGGANLIAFTTGRGSCFGSRPAPTFKLASSSSLYRRMEEDMDFDCGPVVTEGKPIAEMGREIFEHLIDVASGKRTKSELAGYGEDEFAPWQLGATL